MIVEMMIGSGEAIFGWGLGHLWHFTKFGAHYLGQSEGLEQNAPVWHPF
jgi:hypothetical protein